MSTLLKQDQLDPKQVIIEDCIVHARLSTREVTTSKGKKLIITHEIIEPVNERETGDPVTSTVKLDRWLDFVEKNGEEVLHDNALLPVQLIAKAIGHSEEDGEFTTDKMENQIIKIKVEYAPGGVSASGNEYAASNRIKSWLPKDESFEEVQY